MDADSFCLEHETSGREIRDIDDVIDQWESRTGLRKAHDFLGYQTLLTILLADAATGDGLLDQISPDLLMAFAARRGTALDDYDEIRSYLNEMLERGDESVKGLVSQIKGQVGELVFREEAGGHAYLAASTNQEAWDIAIPHAHDATEYIQVKIYSSADHALKMMEEVSLKVADGRVFDGDLQVRHIDFAVNADIADELRRLAAVHPELAGIKIHDIPITEHDAAEIVGDGIANIGPEQLSNLFDQLLGGAISAACLHALSNAFLVYKGEKDVAAGARDTTFSLALSAPGLAAANLTSLALSKVSLPLLSAHPVFAAIAVGMFARAVAKSWYESRESAATLLRGEAEHTLLLERAFMTPLMAKT